MLENSAKIGSFVKNVRNFTMQKPLGMTNFAPVKVVNSFFTTLKLNQQRITTT